MLKKEDELVATNKLLKIIRGEKEQQVEEISDNSSSETLLPVSESLPVSEGSIEESITKPSSQPEEKAIDFGQGTVLPISKKTPTVGNTNLSLPNQRGEIKKNIKSSLGLDFGSAYIKFAQIQYKLNTARLISWGIIKNSHNTQEGGVSAVDTLKKILEGISPSQIKVISSVGGSSVIVRHIKFPPLSNREIDESIRWEAKSYIPFPLREVNIDYQILGRSSKNKQVDVLLVAVTKKLLQEHLDRLQGIQITPKTVDINSLALINSFSLNNQYRDERAFILLDIGYSTTILNIYKKDDLYLTRDIPIAGDAFTRFIQKEKNISYGEAENIKLDKGSNVNMIRPVLDNLTKEIRRSLIYYDNQTSRRGFSRIILTGGGARLAGIENFLSEELGLSVEIANPFQGIQTDLKKFSQEELQYFSPQMALAVGLACR